MKKTVFTVVMALIAVVTFAKPTNGLLWKVTGNGAKNATYILGSHHMAPASFVDSIPGLQQALAEVSAVYGEIDKEAMTSPEAQQAMLSVAMAPADSTLSKLLSPSDMAQLDSLLATYTGMKGMAMQLDMLKPTMVTSQLALLQLQSAFPEMNITQPFDTGVMALGESSGKEIGGLETLEMQLGILFGDPLTVQAEDLMDAVRDNDKLIAQTVALTNSYLAQDLDELTRISTDPEYGINPENLDRLIYNRNRNWAQQLTKLIPEKSMLVIVGAAHLGGDQGVLNLLRKQGFTVEPVSK